MIRGIVGQGDEVTTGQIPFTPRAKKVLELALREALSLGHNYIGTEHILLGLVRENEGVAARILLDFDADSILKPALARGELQTIGATTLDEYRKYLERDAALERRFQQIRVDEPSVEDTVEILRGLRDRYEAHHRCKITEEARAGGELARVSR